MPARSDTFTRADSATSLGSPSDGGSAWVALSGTWGISSNTAYSASSGSQEIAYLESSEANVIVEATITSIFGREGALSFRVVDGSNYCILWVNGTSGFRLYDNVAGSFTQRGSSNTTVPTAGDVVKVEANGTSVTAYLNGSALTGLTGVTMTAHQTATKHGLRAHNSNPAFDLFSITPIAGPSVSLPPRSLGHRMAPFFHF